MAIEEKLLNAANGEWTRWGFSVVPVHAPRAIGGTERNAPFVNFVNDYWKVVGNPDRNGRSPFPWSAAFISFCFKTAGADAKFPYRGGHFDYCAEILKHRDTFAALELADPASAMLEPGDVIWAARAGRDCPRPPSSHSAALADLRNGRWFCSHADIVVALRNGEVDVVGGNVSDSVTRTTYVTVNGHIRDPRHVWLAVIKNGL